MNGKGKRLMLKTIDFHCFRLGYRGLGVPHRVIIKGPAGLNKKPRVKMSNVVSSTSIEIKANIFVQLFNFKTIHLCAQT